MMARYRWLPVVIFALLLLSADNTYARNGGRGGSGFSGGHLGGMSRPSAGSGFSSGYSRPSMGARPSMGSGGQRGGFSGGHVGGFPRPSVQGFRGSLSSGGGQIVGGRPGSSGGNWQGGKHGHWSGRHGFHSYGFYFGYPFYWPSYYYWPYYPYDLYYSAPVVTVPTTPPTYIEQGSTTPLQPPDSNAWSYCTASKNYYPHVKECPGGWQSIAKQPPGQEPGYWYYCNNPAGYYPYVMRCTGIWKQVVP